MSYQVLARKWRPARFQEMVGQEHVLKALVNALDDDRLHHAYLFTGTRGVGKTSIARLFAKSLNCETGVSSSPCGECSACREISEGRFVDLIEVDAASRTKVEDTRDLLENVQYAPTHGRFKVYLIDEVHMLSTHSFNALLKTLEEPPPHVKFLLATTDPQKLPMTILSRCLQFNLKNMIPERIVQHLCHVLSAENLSYEEPALWLLARSADGSMRDAMSLTDQAIAFGAGEVKEADVRAMLGTIDQRLVYRLIETLVMQDAKGLLTAVDELSRFSPDYNTVLGDLISLLHRIALAQVVPDAVDNGMGDREQVLQLAGQLTAEDVQLFYQVALMGRKDLPFVPDAREGLEMVLLRMLAFRPASVSTPVPSREPLAGTDDTASATPDPTAQAPAEAVQAAVAEQPAVIPQPLSAEPARVPASSTAAPLAPSMTAQARHTAKPADTGAAVVAAAPVPQAEPFGAAPQMAPMATDYDDSYMPRDDYDQGGDPLKKPESEGELPAEVAGPAVSDSRMETMPWDDEVVPQAASPAPRVQPPEAAVSVPLSGTAAALVAAEPGEQQVTELAGLQLQHWVVLVDQLGLSGMTYSIAANTSLEAISGELLQFHYAAEQKALLNDTHIERIRSAISDYFSHGIEVKFILGEFTRETPSLYRARKRAERQAQAVQSIKDDPVVQTLIERFNARIDLDSVEPID